MDSPTVAPVDFPQFPGGDEIPVLNSAEEVKHHKNQSNDNQHRVLSLSNSHSKLSKRGF